LLDHITEPLHSYHFQIPSNLLQPIHGQGRKETGGEKARGEGSGGENKGREEDPEGCYLRRQEEEEEGQECGDLQDLYLQGSQTGSS